MTDDNGTMTTRDDYPGYCAAHATACAQHGWQFIPFRFPGCRDCAKPPGFDASKSAFHLFGPQPAATP